MLSLQKGRADGQSRSMMKQSTLLLVTLFGFSSGTVVDICDTDTAKNREKYPTCESYILRNASVLELDQIKTIGVTSDVCKKLESSAWKDLMERVSNKGSSQKLIEILPAKCVIDLADTSEAKFNQVYKELKVSQQKFLTAYLTAKQEKLCASEKAFKDTDIEDALEDHCEKYKKSKLTVDDVAQKTNSTSGNHAQSSRTIEITNVLVGLGVLIALVA